MFRGALLYLRLETTPVPSFGGRSRKKGPQNPPSPWRESRDISILHAFAQVLEQIIVAGVEEDLVAADHPGLFKSCMLFCRACRAFLDAEMLSGCSCEQVELVQ